MQQRQFEGDSRETTYIQSNGNSIQQEKVTVELNNIPLSSDGKVEPLESTERSLNLEGFFKTLYQDAEGTRVIWNSKDKLSRKFSSAQESQMIEFIQEESKQEKDVYFGVCLHEKSFLGSPSYRRGEEETVFALPGFFLDVDFGKTGHSATNCPPDLESALGLVDEFPLAPTWIIHTGGGIHAYWLFKEQWELSDEVERSRAKHQLINFQKFFISRGREKGWQVDNTATLDRILRCPETFNWKSGEPRPVRVILAKENRYNPSEFEQFFDDEAFTLEEFTLLERLPTEYKRKNEIGEKALLECNFIRHCRDNPGKIPEPLWFAMISNVSGLRPGGTALCHEFSKGHPKYSKRETDQKILHAQEAAPHTCKFIRENGFNCERSCSVKSPAGLLFHKSGPEVECVEIPQMTESRREQSGVESPLSYLIQHCYLITGTTCVWDDFLREQMKIEAQRARFPIHFRQWQESKERKEVLMKDIVFSPGEEVASHQINLFEGLPREARDVPIPRIKEHIALLSNQDPEVIHWVTCWLALPLQRIGTKMATALVFHGAQGVGKNILFDAYAKIFGEYFLPLSQTELESSFTGWCSRKLFFLADEVVSCGEHVNLKNKLKTYVTGEHFTINEKFLPVRKEKNHANWVFLSNGDIPLLLERDDRRYMIIRCDQKQGPDYYQALQQEIESGGIEGLYHYLLHYDLKDFHAHTKPLETRDKVELKRLSQQSHERFIDELLSGDLPFPLTSCRADDLYAAYAFWVKRNGEHLVSNVKFGREISKRVVKSRESGGIVYRLDKTGGESRGDEKIGCPIDQALSVQDGIHLFQSALRSYSQLLLH